MLLVTVLWVANGVLYVGLLFFTGQWRRIVPTCWDVVPSAWESLKVYAGFGTPGIEHFLGMAFLAFFTVMHIALVFVVHPDNNLPR